MQGEEAGSPTEEEGDLTSQGEVEVVAEEEEEAEAVVEKEELAAGMTMMISALILDPLGLADLTKDGAVVEVAVVLAGMAVEDGEAGIETETAEAVGIAAARLCQDPWRDPEHA